MGVQAGAETMHEGYSADAQGCRVGVCRTDAVFIQALLHDPQNKAQRLDGRGLPSRQEKHISSESRKTIIKIG